MGGGWNIAGRIGIQHRSVLHCSHRTEVKHPTVPLVQHRIGLITVWNQTKGKPMFSNAYKAVLAFLGLVVTNAVADLMQDGHPFPTNWGDAARWLVTIVVATAGVYGVKPGKGIVTPPARGRHELPE